MALGHPGLITVKNPSKLYDLHSTLPSPPTNFHCPTCELSKSKHIIPKESHDNTTKPFEIVHSDLSGKFSIPSLGGKYYYISFIDDHTRFSWVKFLKTKDEASQQITNFLNFINKQYDVKIKRWRTDNGGEFINKDVHKLFKEKGILHEKTPPYEHDRKGVAERYNQTLTQMARALVINLGLSLWAEAIATVCYLKNRFLHAQLPENTTPYEALQGTKPIIHHLQPFGRNCYIHIHKDSRPSATKLLPRALEAKFVGTYEK